MVPLVLLDWLLSMLCSAVVSSSSLISPSPLVSICEKALARAEVVLEAEVDASVDVPDVEELEPVELEPSAFSISLRLRLPSPFASKLEISELA